MRLLFYPLSRAFSNCCVFDGNAQRISVDGWLKTHRHVRVLKRKRVSLDGALEFLRRINLAVGMLFVVNLIK